MTIVNKDGLEGEASDPHFNTTLDTGKILAEIHILSMLIYFLKQIIETF